MLLLNNKLSQALVNGTKKFAFVAALLCTLGIGSCFASPADSGKRTSIASGNDVVVTIFRKEFRNADLMQVEHKKDYAKVTFRMNGIVMFAYYSDNGDLVAVVRNILSTQLPIHLLMDLKQYHSDCWITDLFEMDNNGQTVYYATLENSDIKITLRSADNSSWETYQKETKATTNP